MFYLQLLTLYFLEFCLFLDAINRFKNIKHYLKYIKNASVYLFLLMTVYYVSLQMTTNKKNSNFKKLLKKHIFIEIILQRDVTPTYVFLPYKNRIYMVKGNKHHTYELILLKYGTAKYSDNMYKYTTCRLYMFACIFVCIII